MFNAMNRKPSVNSLKTPVINSPKSARKTAEGGLRGNIGRLGARMQSPTIGKDQRKTSERLNARIQPKTTEKDQRSTVEKLKTQIAVGNQRGPRARSQSFARTQTPSQTRDPPLPQWAKDELNGASGILDQRPSRSRSSQRSVTPSSSNRRSKHRGGSPKSSGSRNKH